MAISPEISAIVANALREDIGSGDVTSVPIIPADRQLRGVFLVKAPGIVAGLDVVAEVFCQVDAAITFIAMAADGDAVQTDVPFPAQRRPGLYGDPRPHPGRQ